MNHSGKEMVAAVTPGGEGLGVGATEPSKPSTQTRQCGSPGREMLAMIGVWRYFRPTARRIVASLISAAWSFFFNHWATSRQIDKFDRWSGGPGVPHNSIAACLTSSRSGCLRAACGVVAVMDAWRLSRFNGEGQNCSIACARRQDLARADGMAEWRRAPLWKIRL